MKNIIYFSILFLLLSLHETSFGKQNLTDRDSVTISSKWIVGHESVYKASLLRTIINDTIGWYTTCSAEQHIRISRKLKDGFEIEWTASGFTLNMFYDFPGTMFDWAEEWLEDKTLLLKIRTNINGTPVEINNKEEVRTFFTGMINSLLDELSIRNVAPLDKKGVKKALLDSRDRVIQSPGFANYFIKNIQLIFFLYNKSFYINQNNYLTVYNKVPTLNFTIPMKINTKFIKKGPNIIEVISSVNPHPYELWKIKPKGYRKIDFEIEKYTRFVYDKQSSWINTVESTYNFKRGKYIIASNLTFIRVK